MFSRISPWLRDTQAQKHPQGTLWNSSSTGFQDFKLSCYMQPLLNVFFFFFFKIFNLRWIYILILTILVNKSNQNKAIVRCASHKNNQVAKRRSGPVQQKD